jgi:uncharacterized protein with HEPN domain
MSERDFTLYLKDILDSGSAITEYVNDMSFDDFCNDRKRCVIWYNRLLFLGGYRNGE